MKSYNELERAKKDKIRQLSVDEAERYITKLNKEMADAWGSLDNGYEVDTDTMMKNSALCDEAVDILSDKYKMDLLVASSRSNALVDKQLEDREDAKNLLLEIKLDHVMSTYWKASHNILILTQFLNLLYEFYWTSPHDVEVYLDESNAAEDTIAPVMKEISMEKIPVYSMYNQHYMNSVELNIKHMTKVIDGQIKLLKELINFTFKNPEVSTGTYYDTFRDGMLHYQQLSHELIAKYEEIKLDGFKNAKTIEAELLSNCLDKDVEYFNEMFKNSRPSYDTINFIFIPPKVHIESMAKYHPDWKYEKPAADDDLFNDEGMDDMYRKVM